VHLRKFHYKSFICQAPDRYYKNEYGTVLTCRTLHQEYGSKKKKKEYGSLFLSLGSNNYAYSTNTIAKKK
jgi:hypothetical protein